MGPTDEHRFKAGDLLMFSQGSYSDYQVGAHARAKVDGDMEKLADQWLRSIRGRLEEWEEPRVEAFIEWLTKAGVIEVLDVAEVYVGDWPFQIGRVKATFCEEDWRLLDEEDKA